MARRYAITSPFETKESNTFGKMREGLAIPLNDDRHRLAQGL